MKPERYSGWLALAANLGVLGGLVLVAVELRHNSQVVRAQAATNLLSGQTSAELAFMGDDTAAAFATAITSPGETSNREIVQLWAYMNSALLSVQQTHAMFELGLATEEDMDDAARTAAHWLGWNYGQVWWSEMKSNFPAELVGQVDTAITTVGADYLTRQFEGLRKGMTELAAP